MKSKLYVLLLILLPGITGIGYSQTGIGTNTPDPSAQLEVSGTDKGILIPRMTEAQRNAIPAPATGLLIFQTDGSKGFYYFDGTSWIPLSAPGPASSETIIPFASGMPIVLSTGIADVKIGSAIGFGNSVNGIIIDGTIDISQTNNMAFSVPRDGLINSISGFFSASLGLNLIGSTLEVTAQLYAAAPFDTEFIPVPGASVTLSPGYANLVTVGMQNIGQVTGLGIPVTTGTRLLLLVYSKVDGVGVPTTLPGYFSGGVGIE